MKNLVAWIEKKGGLEALKQDSFTVPARGAFMCLAVEHIGVGPHGYPAISVAHYFEQNGDLMQDPEMMFEYWAGQLWPYAFQQASPSIYQEVYGKTAEGKSGVRVKLKRELETFARQWDRNLKNQGFFKPVEEAKSA